MPQLSTDYLFSQIFWLIVSMGMIYTVFILYLYPNILTIQKFRTKKTSNLKSKLQSLSFRINKLNEKKRELIYETDDKLKKIELEAITYLNEFRSEIYKKSEKMEFVSKKAILQSLNAELSQLESRIDIIVRSAIIIITNTTDITAVDRNKIQKMCYQIL